MGSGINNEKIAIVLLNLGAPDSLKAVQPFLYNLFNDPAIISLPSPFRQLLAALISWRRNKKACEIYSLIGGKSPLLFHTKKQADALAIKTGMQCFVAMRYWHPFASSVVKELQQYAPTKIIALPLYPQHSTTTTGSSINDLRNELRRAKLSEVPFVAIDSYHLHPLFIKAHVDLINKTTASISQEFRLLFSAHGLPQKIIDKGDLYQQQIEETAAAINMFLPTKGKVCYQSKVGPLKWLEPSTESEIIKTGEEKKAVAIVPIAFVSEHSETLVELDIEYAALAKKHGVPAYYRVPTLAEHEDFIAALADIVRSASR